MVDTSPANRLVDLGDGASGCIPVTGPIPRKAYEVLVILREPLTITLGEKMVRHLENVRNELCRDGEVSDEDLAVGGRDLRSEGVGGGNYGSFLTIGTLEWSEDSTQGRRVRSPLLLVPVTSGTSHPSSTEITASGEVMLNPTLVHMLRGTMRLSLPALPPQQLDVDGFLEEVRRNASPRGWTVTPALYLGQFEMPDVRRYEELDHYRDLMVAHPIIRTIAYGDGGSSHGDAPSVSSQSIYSVLDADSSQLDAVALAAAGTSFVLQGPPGTGKSQTIVNIIAEEMGRGRTVLLVSDVRSDLDTVKRRLDGCGLGRYCLEVHHPDQDVREVADELSRCLSFDQTATVPTFDEQQLRSCRSYLDDYRDALHQVREGVGISFRQILTELTRLRSVQEVPMGFPGLERMSMRYLDSLQPLVEDIERLATVLAAEEHPWADCEVEKWHLTAQSEIMRRLSDLKMARTRLEEKVRDLCQEYDLPLPQDLKGTKELIEHLRVVNLTHYPEESWLSGDPAALENQVEDIREAYKERLDRMTGVRQLFRDEVMDLDLKDMLARFTTEDRRMTARLFDPAYRRDMSTLEELKRGPRKLRYAQVCEELQELVETSELVARVKSKEEECSKSLGRHFQGERTDWNKTLAAIRWTRDYRHRYGTPTSPGIINLLCSGPERLVGLKTKMDAVEEASSRLVGAISAIRERFDLSALTNGRTVEEVPFEDLNDWAQRHLDNAASFQEWTEVVRVRREGKERGLEDLLYLVSRSMTPREGLWEGVRKRYLRSWYDLLLSRDDRLRSFERERYQQTASLYAELDRKSMELAAHRIASAVDLRRRGAFDPASGHDARTAFGEAKAIDACEKPLRVLFSHALEPILALKPCIIMNPLSMTSLLDPATTLFDLAIIDGASQMRIEDGIAAILRAKQVVVVGDSMHLPPCGRYPEDGANMPYEGCESILDACVKALPQRFLGYHYRSQDESLFAFSNHHFYGDRVVTFPSPQLERGDLGVTFHYVPGIGDDVGSECREKEARMVVDLMIEHLAKRPRESLGVVAFTEGQRRAIAKELARREVQHPRPGPGRVEEREGGLFITTLGNVQGDARDVIILSLGLSKDEPGTGRQGAEEPSIVQEGRLVNVAMTLARKRLLVVSSLLPEEMAEAPTGENLVRDLLTYATWPGHYDTTTGTAFPDDPIREDVRRRLEDRGLKVDVNVGRSSIRMDLAVVDDDRPGRYLLGIMLDGPSYLQAGPARDRERLRQEVLSGLGWDLHRLWSQDWLRDPEGETNRILKAVDRCRKEAGEREAREEIRPLEALVASLAVDERAEEMVFLTLHDEVENVERAAMTSTAFEDDLPYTSGEGASSAFVGSAGSPTVDEGGNEGSEDEDIETVERPEEGLVEECADLPDETARELCPLYTIARIHEDPSLVYLFSKDQEKATLEAVRRVIVEEGPVHIGVLRDRVKELVAVATGKRPYTVDRSIRPAISTLERGKKIRVEGDFLWPADLATVRPRRCYAPRRDVEHVSDEELEAMVRMVLTKDPSSRMRRIVNEVSDLLGYKRSTKAIRKRIERTVDIIEMRRDMDERDEAEGRSPASRPGVPDEVREEACP